MTENSAIVKIVANHTREMEELREKYDLLGKKHLTMTESFVDLKIFNKQLRGENKKFRVLLQVAKKEIQNQRVEILKTIDYIMKEIEFHTENPDSELMDEVSEEYKKWEAKE